MIQNGTTRFQVAHDCFEALELSPGSVIRRNESLAKRTTLRVGGPADFFIEPATQQDLAKVIQFCGACGMPFFILGRGSNLLIRDGGIRGVVISLNAGEFSKIEIEGEILLCGAGARLKEVAVTAKRHSLGGLEFLEGIPGSVGGALRMNAGAMGSSMFEAVQSVRFMDRSGIIHEAPVAEIPAQYRSCPFFSSHIAVGARLTAKTAPRKDIDSKMAEGSRKRWDSQPAAPSAGCIFKNSPEVSTGRLVDELGMKGLRQGGAMISDVHGNFIVTEPGATARDVLGLIDLIKTKARQVRGIELETEVQIVGEDLPNQTWESSA